MRTPFPCLRLALLKPGLRSMVEHLTVMLVDVFRLHGRVHSAACKARYRTWLEQERQKQSEALSRELPAPLALKGA